MLVYIGVRSAVSELWIATKVIVNCGCFVLNRKCPLGCFVQKFEQIYVFKYAFFKYLYFFFWSHECVFR